MGNFDFLQKKKNFNSFNTACLEAEKSILVSPSTCATITRRALELAVKWLYANDSDLVLPYQDNLSTLIHNNSFIELIDYDMLPLLKYIVKLGNLSVHTSANIERGEAILSLNNLHQFVSWIDYCYSDEYTAEDFNEDLLLHGEEKRTRPDELKNLYERLSSKDKKLEEVIKENEKLRKSLTEKRKVNTVNYDFKIDEVNEFETRKRYINIELKLAGWEFGKDIGEEIEVQGMPNESGVGYVDYVLYGENGKPLAVVEAKRTSKDPKIGQQQAKLYADCLEKRYSQRPVIFLTNGFDMYIWDDYSDRKVYGFYKKSELQLMIDRRKSKKSLSSVTINDEISNRYYQKEAIRAVCEALENKQRKTLLVCATGTGKTRIAISIVDVLSRHNWIKNILFLADRKALVKQAKKSFTKLLPNLALCNLLDSKDSPEDARMIFSTYPTMMNAIDDTKSKDGKRLFTPGHFDLIIIDESHRSIYKKYKSIFDYFDSYLMGLTATPKDEIDKNTYSVFDMENGVPTYAYEYNKAVEDGYLVDYTSIEFKTKIMEDGIKYDELSDEEKEEYENTFNDDESIGDEIGNNAVNEWLFNSDTIDLVLNKLMTEGLKIEGEEKIGKTIIFAKNTKHARAIVERFNKLYPKYGGNFVKAVDYSINYVDSIIDDFSDKNKLPQIAVSVDMLDTGIDIPEILNLVFFKKVRSKTKFWQMIGRGTRLCPDLLGVDMDKERFLIFDFCNNFEFFKFNPKGFEGNKAETLTEKLFNIKVSMVKELQDIKYIEGKYAELRKELLEELITSVKALNEDSYIVRMNLSYVHKYKNENVWSNIGAVAQNEIREYISPLITSYSDDELAKRFDVVMYNIQLAYLQNNNASKGIRHVMVTAEKLSKLGTIPQIQQQKYTIEKAMTEDFWEDSDIFEVEEVRISLRELIKYLEKSSQKIYYTSFEDMIVAEDRNDSVYNANNLKNYKKKVEYYLNSHKDELAIFKLRNNKKITKQDVETLEEILLKQLGNCDDYKKEFGDTPVSQLVRKLVGLDREAANEAFSEFLNNKSFNTKQIHFVKLIVDYVVKNGFIEDNKVLMEDPFRTVGSIIDLFENHIEERNKLIKTINKIKENASEIG
ncbi:type i restriction enzyme r subunit [Clostridioides difficile]|uniref:Type i restriction enzyme r subunit n=3 Tax=Clostridioides difficile TaxID=1496 RepID=A0A9R0BMT8_CLODR|nr:DEAD/DEAH box helicase family protein [Clostridioides difficile]OFT99470.1 DEAD/DEAH box helicase [Clostridium sp. HMSC19E03]OFU16777.1 DEAD/DEAH box helicase [Clostridium sp. HMSC19C08]OFU20306.1 DEAD/DEAH box helicase [Clostridium sp. HMSC19C05]OFU22415.1 DEAD/DEAH box helicase [Clostridium sp. HMSC19C09]OFU27610.1 DEAD/DEAH box helicase [Clostridium sp. HMSC19B11]OFU32333.1 DEAD/DEAH box helicase [Clostridium sp. HMSC19B10]OFU46497.1 DEAD/DEAH box helicase [Clostridium sp. HMSC19B01]